MNKQIILAVSREFGSGGHDIAELVAKELSIPMYDRSIIQEIAEGMDMDAQQLLQYDEKPRNRILTRTVLNHTNSMEEILLNRQFEFIEEKANEGKSFVIVGRCAETVLRNYPGLISVFVTGDADFKTKRIMEQFSLSEKEAQVKRLVTDKKRKVYHNRYADHKWGDSRYYDLCINSTPLGIEGTAALLKHYVLERIQRM